MCTRQSGFHRSLAGKLGAAHLGQNLTSSEYAVKCRRTWVFRVRWEVERDSAVDLAIGNAGVSYRIAGALVLHTPGWVDGLNVGRGVGRSAQTGATERPGLEEGGPMYIRQHDAVFLPAEVHSRVARA